MAYLERDGQQVGFGQVAALRIAQVQRRMLGMVHYETIFISLRRQHGELVSNTTAQDLQETFSVKAEKENYHPREV